MTTFGELPFFLQERIMSEAIPDELPSQIVEKLEQVKDKNISRAINQRQMVEFMRLRDEAPEGSMLREGTERFIKFHEARAEELGEEIQEMRLDLKEKRDKIHYHELYRMRARALLNLQHQFPAS